MDSVYVKFDPYDLNWSRSQATRSTTVKGNQLRHGQLVLWLNRITFVAMHGSLAQILSVLCILQMSCTPAAKTDNSYM